MPAVGPMIAATAEGPAGILCDVRGIKDADLDGLMECSTEERDMALFDKQAMDEGLVFDLGGVQEIETIAVWNYNKPAYTDMGVAQAAVSVWTQEAGWKTLAEKASLLEAEGTSDYDEATLLTFAPVAAAKVRLDHMAGFSDKNTQIGLSKVRFYSPLGPAACNPQPQEKSAAGFKPCQNLSWTAGKDALVHEVYLSEESSALKRQGRFTGLPRVGVEGLKPETTYYWYVVETQENGTATEGPLWSFKTGAAMAAWWPLEENAADTTGAFNGTIQGSPQWVEGKTGKALQLDGKTNWIEVSPLKLASESMTICGWLRTAQENPPFTGIVFCRSANTATGLNFSNDRSLGYHWQNASNTYGWESGLKVPLNKWVFAAVTVEPSKAVLYLWDGQDLKTAVNEVSHGTETFDVPIQIGRDPVDNTRFFNGAIDDVRFFGCALNKDQIMALCSDQPATFAGQIRLVNADFVSDDLTLDQIARKTEQTNTEAPAVGGRKINLMAVAIIGAAVLAMVFVTTLKKKK